MPEKSNVLGIMKQLTQLPDHARIWIYAATRPFADEECEYISARLETFIPNWQAHGANLEAAFDILHKRFVVIAVDEGLQNATGCSIDACVSELKDISKVLNIDLFNRMQVIYRDLDNNLVVSCSIAELKEMIAHHDFPDDTLVFNNSITTLGELRKAWEIPATESWVSRYLSAIKA